MNTCKRIILDADPEQTSSEYVFFGSSWKTWWIQGPDWDGLSPIVWAFRKKFSVNTAETIRVSLTADQRYDLYLDGERIAWGSERSMVNNWMYETLELTLDPGEHVLVARVWWSGIGTLAHDGHSTEKPGFLFHGHGKWADILDTREGTWEAISLPEYSFLPVREISNCKVIYYFCCGGYTAQDLRLTRKGWQKGEGDGWVTAITKDAATFRKVGNEAMPNSPHLAPGVLPPMFEETISPGTACWAAAYSGSDYEKHSDDPEQKILKADSDPALVTSFNELIAGKSSVTVPANSSVRVIFDLNEYHCFFEQLRVSGGRDAVLTVRSAESLYDNLSTDYQESQLRGNRAALDGKYFMGVSNRYTANGEANQFFEPLWFICGCWVQLSIVTKDEPLELSSFALRSTHYPIRWDYSFTSDDPRMDVAQKIMRRTLEMCSHESYFDCPYYEQMMYGGDSRLEILATYTSQLDDRLPRKAMLLFDRSRSESGITLSRVPSRIKQVIPPYSLHWCMMVYDYAMWRNDKQFVRDRLDGVRSVMIAFRKRLGEEGLIRSPIGWNFTDWAEGFPGGITPAGQPGGVSATLNLHYAWVLNMAAELEDLCGDPELAAWDRRIAKTIAEAVNRVFWDEERSLYAEDTAHTFWLEHPQCMAICGGFVPENKREALGNALATDPALTRATVYYNYYLLESFRLLHRPDDLYKNFDTWFTLEEKGFKTVFERPEPTRSDCHAWGAHPLAHLVASIAGISPAAPGFEKVRIEPQLGPLSRIDTTAPHPRGKVCVKLARNEKGLLAGEVSTPEGIPSTLLVNGKTFSWNGGAFTVEG